MIEQAHIYTIRCDADDCDAAVGGFDNFADALVEAECTGWTDGVDGCGRRVDYCPTCSLKSDACGLNGNGGTDAGAIADAGRISRD